MTKRSYVFSIRSRHPQASAPTAAPDSANGSAPATGSSLAIGPALAAATARATRTAASAPAAAPARTTAPAAALALALATALALALATLTACSAPAANPATQAFPNAKPSDMSGYPCAASYEQPYQFVDVTVQDAVAQMDAGQSFVLFAGFTDCPWCDVVLNPLNDAALECGVPIGYLDTRSNPAWKSNTEIDDYDLFVERFGAYLDTDDNDEPHLYVPIILYVKDGQPIDAHKGTVPGQESATDPVSDQQLAELTRSYVKEIERLL